MSEEQEEHDKPCSEPVAFGDTELGQGLGCGFVIICIGVAIALVIAAANYLPR